MGYKVTTQPTIEPITLAEAKNYLQIDDFTDDDALINDLIKAARVDTEKFLNVGLIEQTVKQYYNDWENNAVYGSSLRLSLSPVLSIESIQYVDTDGATQTLASTEYQTDLVNLPCHIYAGYNKTLPTVRTQTVNAVTVTYKVGYGTTAADVPRNIKNAMYLMIRDWYDNRENPVREKMHTAARNILAKVRRQYL